MFTMKNEPRWVCLNDSQHQKMRASDLNLPKMAALTPSKAEQKKVEQFFAMKKKEKETF